MDYEEDIQKDETEPISIGYGIPRKRLGISRLGKLGWQAKMELKDGIRETYRWYWGTLIP